ncbi:helix-turn-helix domain-containing protein [Salegentibacter sp. F188]|uniref:Helix-turn-helix domain-containing protein n=1 Tax=Autumnicola patrickiae TaxID=3075591 RepID=A0ABU3E7K1_9FLAO|nr:helix-turn-helix domain-containing protein [Salegentibacter sp. F188]MDT0691957.1 helix-turn-helix domain-containing protein [Salegentibacter sp. F188]
MKSSAKTGYVKRTQKDYSISFKLQVVQEIESGALGRTQACHKYGIQAKSTVREWLRKYGNFDWENQSRITVAKTPEQKILELEAKVKLLEKQKARAEHLAQRADKKVIIFDMLVDMAEKEYDIQIRKNYKPELSNASKKPKKRR